MLSFSAAQPASLELATHGLARERGVQRGKTKKKISGGRKTKQLAKQESKKTQKPFFVCDKRSSLPYSDWRRERGEKQQEGRSRKAKAEIRKRKLRDTESAHKRQAESGINERGGERRQGKATLTHALRE